MAAAVRAPTVAGGIRPAGTQGLAASTVRPPVRAPVRPPVSTPVSASVRPGTTAGGPAATPGVKRPWEQAAGGQAPGGQAPGGQATAGKGAKVPRVMASRLPGSSPVPSSQRVKRPLDDDDEVLQEEDGDATMAQLVADWDGTVLSIADIAARETDQTIAKHIADAQAIAAMHFDDDVISKIVRDSGYRLTMLIEDSTTVTGFLVYSYNKTGIDVEQMAIAEAHRGRGLGRCAVTWLLEHAKKAGLEFICVGCTVEGVHFYERCGFKQGSRTPAGHITMCLTVSGTETVTPVNKGKTVAPPKAGVQAPKAGVQAPKAGVQPPKAGVPPPKAGGKAPAPKEQGHVPAPKDPGFMPAPKDPGFVPAPKESGFVAAPKLPADPAKGKTVAPPKVKGRTVKPKAKATPEAEIVTMSRGAIIMKIFEFCDADGDKFINELEMRTFATGGGFEGSAEEWTKDWRALCTKISVDASKGLDMVRFEQVINDGGAGFYTDEELHSIFAKLDKEAKSAEYAAGRAELIRLVFEACDVDKDEALSQKEMKRVAIHIGFNGTDEEWAQEYSDMCLDNKRDPALGINLELFEKLVDDDSESGCYCSNVDLEAALNNTAASLQEAGPKTVKPPPKRPGINMREGVTLGLFKALDNDGDGYLNLKEMKAFASLIGFKCDDEKWAKEYALFCEQGDADPAVGVNATLFQKLVDDRSDAGCYCSDAELKDMLKELNPNAGEISSRGALISAVFKACDQDGDDRLKSSEMRDFAGFTGFDGDAEAWSKEFAMLCSEVSANPSEGVDLRAFTKLVNDTSERGCYCRDVELATMVRQMNASNFLGGGGDGGGGDAGARMSLTPVSRAAIIRTIFHLCDKDGNKLLNEDEMRTFAVTAGFEGSKEEWGKEYRFVCSRSNTEPSKGLNPAKFIQVINNGSAGRYSDPELKGILEKMELQACLDAGASGRSGIVRAVFHACDLDSDGYLNRQEMKHIATHVGFKGTPEEWAKEYQGMCIDHGADPVAGIDLAMLETLVNDNSESGCYCSDRDLRSVLQSMGEVDGNVVKVTSGQQDVARFELIRSVFKSCDLDHDGLLDEQEMRAFAYHVGFEGTNDEWSREFSILCREKKASGGIDLLLFEKLVNDNSESGCHCTTQQLQMILTKLDLGFR